MITTVGLNHIADQLAAIVEAVMSHMAIGTGTTPENAADTTLGTEVARVALDSKVSSVGPPKVTYIATFGAGVGTGAITEVGVFNDAGAGLGTLLSRILFSVINKSVNSTIEFTIEHTYAAP